MAGARDSALAMVREICLDLPGASERPSHGSPACFIDSNQTFVMLHDHHHGDGRLALWCAAPEGAQGLLTASNPERYFVPPYVGHRGWIGLRLDRDATRDEIAGVIEDAWLDRAPKRRLAELDDASG
jgi:hypothetical protein